MTERQNQGRDFPAADLHVHATFAPASRAAAAAGLLQLRRRGLKRLLLYVSAEPFEVESYRTNLLRVDVPGLPEHVATGALEPEPEATRKLLDHLDGLEGEAPVVGIVPMIRSADAAALRVAIAGLDSGAPALKIVHAPERVDATRQALRAAHDRAFAAADDADVPVILHVDLRTDGDWAEAALRATDATRVCIAHLGYSRRAQRRLFENYPVVADIANLAEKIEESADGYVAFLEAFAGRVVFGSDAFLGGLGRVAAHANAINSLPLSPGATDALLDGSWTALFGEGVVQLDPRPPVEAMMGAAT